MEEKLKQKVNIIPEMGADTSKAFSGDASGEALLKVYGESAKLFADLIKKYLPKSDDKYVLADLGSFKGELLQKIIAELQGDYSFKTIAIDINESALDENTADEKINSSIDSLPLADKSVDVSMMRYALQWNSLEKQREIIKEIHRITKKLAIIQHCCPDDDNADAWREHMDDVLDGEEVPKMKRIGHYFASPAEIETIMADLGINFQKISDVRANSISEIFITRYNLSVVEAEKIKQLFGNFDYEEVVTWVLLPDSLE